ncbi:hypothetical protein [Embleya sp. NPDC059259]|uniref:hypothetical protein n=1 Tax=unclassified Embleya TaxID=2699296 RepID=UPI0036B02693
MRIATVERALALTCRVHTEPHGDDHTIAYTLRFNVTAPRTARVGEEFEIVLVPAPITFSAKLSSGIDDIALCFRIPTHARVVRHTLTGGEALGEASPYTEPLPGGRLVLRAPGPFRPEVPFTLPALSWRVCADGSGPVETGLAGTDFADPAWSYRWARAADAVSGDVTGFPDPVVDPSGTLGRTVPML